MTSFRVDLNADVGESFGIYTIGNDELLLRYVTSANIACGFHAGDPCVMRSTVRLAGRAGVAIGAHPGFPDLAGFGRREINVRAEEICDQVLYQIGALSAIAKAEGLRLQHVKPHGALYNMSVRRADVADAIAGAVASFDESLVVIGLPGSELALAAARFELRFAAEAFADRSYEADGSLTPRDQPGAVLTHPAAAVDRAIRMVRERKVEARSRELVSINAETICVHGDTPDSAALAAAVREGLESAGVTVAALKLEHPRRM